MTMTMTVSEINAMWFSFNKNNNDVTNMKL